MKHKKFINLCMVIAKKVFLFSAILLLIAGCAYPFASFSNSGAMPPTFSKRWSSPRHEQRKINRMPNYEVDPNSLSEVVSLAEAINFALENNPDTAIAWAAIQESIAQLGTARQDYFPVIKGNANLARERRNFVEPPDTLIGYWITVGGPEIVADYTLWDFGKRFAQSQSALQALYSMAWAYNQELQNVIRTLTNDYYQLLYQKAVLINTEQDVSDAQLILQAAQDKLQFGVADITDLVQAQTSYLKAQVNNVQQKDSTQNSMVDLVTSMGIRSNYIIQTQDFPCNLPGDEYLKTVDEFIDIALECRPDLIKSKADVYSKRAALAQAKLDPMPKFTGHVDWEYVNTTLYPAHWDYTMIFQVDVPLFTGFKYTSGIRKARAALRESEAKMKQQQDNILKDVTSNYNNYRNTLERIEYTCAFLEASYQEFQVTLSNYRAGTGDIINVMQAQTSLSDARSKYTESVRDLFKFLTNLAYATGSLVTPQIEESSWQGVYDFESEDIP